MIEVRQTICLSHIIKRGVVIFLSAMSFASYAVDGSHNPKVCGKSYTLCYDHTLTPEKSCQKFDDSGRVQPTRREAFLLSINPPIYYVRVNHCIKISVTGLQLYGGAEIKNYIPSDWHMSAKGIIAIDGNNIVKGLRPGKVVMAPLTDEDVSAPDNATIYVLEEKKIDEE